MGEAAVMHVILTFAAAEKQWGEKAHLTLAHQPDLGATWQIHLDRSNSLSQNLFLIQTAARKLDNQGIKAVALIGDDWNAESCFAFWQGYRNPKAEPQITYPQLDNVQQKQLDNWLLTAEWVRETINMPAEDLGPQQLADRAINLLQQVAPANSLTVETLVGDELLAKQYMGLHTVGRGSTRAPVYLRIDFNPTSDAQAKTFACLVGKGITFDTGGYSLKQSNFMDSMKSDMGGSALAAGSFALAILQGLNKRVQLILCCADNMVSGNAFRLGDIIHYRNGKRVEVMNTDAEGRLVLADGLIDASHINPEYIIDCATLTGAAKIAVGNDYHSIMTFDDQFADKLLAVAKQEHEGFWRLPLEEFHRKQMPSSFADITNTSSPAHTAGACIAAAFLSHFVERYQTNWLHIDCSATYRKSPVEQWATGATGVGVRTLASLLLS